MCMLVRVPDTPSSEGGGTRFIHKHALGWHERRAGLLCSKASSSIPMRSSHRPGVAGWMADGRFGNTPKSHISA